jgi:hypothetical protein
LYAVKHCYVVGEAAPCAQELLMSHAFSPPNVSYYSPEIMVVSLSMNPKCTMHLTFHKTVSLTFPVDTAVLNGTDNCTFLSMNNSNAVINVDWRHVFFSHELSSLEAVLSTRTYSSALFISPIQSPLVVEI